MKPKKPSSPDAHSQMEMTSFISTHSPCWSLLRSASTVTLISSPYFPAAQSQSGF